MTCSTSARRTESRTRRRPSTPREVGLTTCTTINERKRIVCKIQLLTIYPDDKRNSRLCYCHPPSQSCYLDMCQLSVFDSTYYVAPTSHLTTEGAVHQPTASDAMGKDNGGPFVIGIFGNGRGGKEGWVWLSRKRQLLQLDPRCKGGGDEGKRGTYMRVCGRTNYVIDGPYVQSRPSSTSGCRTGQRSVYWYWALTGA